MRNRSYLTILLVFVFVSAYSQNRDIEFVRNQYPMVFESINKFARIQWNNQPETQQLVVESQCNAFVELIQLKSMNRELMNTAVIDNSLNGESENNANILSASTQSFPFGTLKCNWYFVKEQYLKNKNLIANNESSYSNSPQTRARVDQPEYSTRPVNTKSSTRPSNNIDNQKPVNKKADTSKKRNVEATNNNGQTIEYRNRVVANSEKSNSDSYESNYNTKTNTRPNTKRSTNIETNYGESRKIEYYGEQSYSNKDTQYVSDEKDEKKVKFGVNLGWGLGFFGGESSVNEGVKNHYLYSLGALANVKLSDLFYFQTNLDFELNRALGNFGIDVYAEGQPFEDDLYLDQEKYSLTLYGGIRKALSPTNNLMFGVGPYVAYVSHRFRSKDDFGYSISFDEFANRLDCGVSATIAFELKHFLFSTKGNLGLLNMYNAKGSKAIFEVEQKQFKTSSLSLGVAYLF